jgi:hypothetical protein
MYNISLFGIVTMKYPCTHFLKVVMMEVRGSREVADGFSRRKEV